MTDHQTPQRATSGPNTPQRATDRGTGAGGPHGRSETAEPTPAECAAAEVLARAGFRTAPAEIYARHILDAARPHLLAQYCLELADAADQLGPITADNLRAMAREYTEGTTR